MSRKTQVLQRLQVAKGEWVNGTELANEQVGGSEGLKRLRELRAEGYPIEQRPHPNPGRMIHQYRLVTKEPEQLSLEEGMWDPGRAFTRPFMIRTCSGDSHVTPHRSCPLAAPMNR